MEAVDPWFGALGQQDVRVDQLTEQGARAGATGHGRAQTGVEVIEGRQVLEQAEDGSGLRVEDLPPEVLGDVRGGAAEAGQVAVHVVRSDDS